MPTPEQSELLEIIGSHIRALREGQGFAQEDFAERAGMDRTYYAGIERGERNFSVLNLLRLANAFDVSVADLIPPAAIRKTGRK